jgi:hypothetical protein
MVWEDSIQLGPPLTANAKQCVGQEIQSVTICVPELLMSHRDAGAPGTWLVSASMVCPYVCVYIHICPGLHNRKLTSHTTN